MGIEARPLATVVICTRDRARSLSRTLESLVHAARHVEDLWEVVVVDNGSTDDTPLVVRDFTGALPLRLVHEANAGLSNARNAGVAEARGDYILWTDDDVLVDVNWLTEWFKAFKERPNDALFGGRSEPLLEEPKAEWFEAAIGDLGSLLAIRDEPTWSEITPSRIPYGLNYAVRACEQRTCAYDPELGVAPGRRRGGEEVAVLRQLLANGSSGSWVWDATVYHIIPRSRQSLEYIRTFYQSNGEDLPIGGKVVGFIPRLKGSIRSARALIKAGLTLRRCSSHNVRATIQLARAEGSLIRHLGGLGSLRRPIEQLIGKCLYLHRGHAD